MIAACATPPSRSAPEGRPPIASFGVCVISQDRVSCLATAVAGTVDEAHRVQRGGSFNNEASNVRCAARNNDNPENRNDNHGFRVGFAPLRSTPEWALSSRATGSAGDAMRSKACPKAALPRFGGEARPVPGRASLPGRAKYWSRPVPCRSHGWGGATFLVATSSCCQHSGTGFRD